ncbi:MAG: tRNA (guanosine(37)-N1)-methyltransferase TrmD [Verrucomicrobiales bacterium]|nr:tRNA (guanosine(37)-N1)-methyltransferase TrmD [Verrucomicrobiales bacterium]
MKIDVLTLFPEMLAGPLQASIVSRAQRGGQVRIDVHDIRDYAHAKHRTVDDRPFGGGPGMVMKCEPLVECIESVQTRETVRGRVVYLTPEGVKFDQVKALEYSKLERLIFVSGHYEGVDERVREGWIDEELSIGDYVLSNGTIAALIVIDAVVRLLPGVLGNEASAQMDSFGADALLEGPQYTRPEEFRGRKVPEILLTGHHAAISAWRKEQAARRTSERRKDLLEKSKNIGSVKSPLNAAANDQQ